jgi:hypothetical protein
MTLKRKVSEFIKEYIQEYFQDALAIYCLKHVLSTHEFDSSLKRHNLHDDVICAPVERLRCTHPPFRVTYLSIT